MQQHALAARKEEATISEVKAEDATVADASLVKAEKKAPRQNEKPKTRTLDVSSDEAFPTLGGGSVKPISAHVPSGWGAGMFAPIANGNGGNGGSATTSTGAFTPAVQGSSGQSTVYLLPTQKRPASELRRAPIELVKDIMRSTSTKIEMQQTSNQTTVFIISGTEANRQKAHREIHKEMSAKKTVTIKIPAIVRPHIIGKAGSKVQELENMTATRIKVPQMQPSDGPVAEYDDEDTIDITIEGDEYGVPIAVQKINAIVAERTITVTTRIPDIPGELYPFIQGPHRKLVEEYEARVQRVQVPDYFYSAKSQPFSPPSGPIVITGEKQAVQEVRAEIESKVAEFKAAGFHSVLVPVSKAKHPFFTLNKGQLIHEVLAKAGCTVILPEGAKANSLMVYGPSDKIPQGYEEVLKASNSYQLAAIDVCKAYPNAAGGPKLQARDITRYLKRTGEFASLQSEFDLEITTPSDDELYDLQKPCVIQIIGKSTETLNGAKAKIQELYSKLTPGRVLRFEVEPLHHRLIVGKDGRGVKRITDKFPGLGLLLPDDTEEAEIVLIYGGRSEDAEEITKALEGVKEHILSLVEAQKFDVTEKVITIPRDLHAKVQGEDNTTINALNPTSLHVRFGAPKARPGKPAAAASPGDEDKITIRGAKANVDNLALAIQQFVASIPEDGNIPIVTEQFGYPLQLSAQLIGSKGANVNKLRAGLGVEINLKEGQGEIKGIQVAVDAAKRKLNSQIKEHLDKAIEHLKIPQEFHSTIIGSGGNSVRKLETRYGVRIMFPRSGSHKDADGANIPAKQEANEVIIKGGKDGVSKACAEILALWEYEKEKSFTATIPITGRGLEFMFKNASREIKQLRDESSIRLDIPQRDAIEKDEQAIIKIRGTQDEVKNAKTILSKIVKEAEQTTQRSISVEKQYHRSLIGPGGQTLKGIVVGAGGPDDKQALARVVRFPNQDSESNEIVVQGNSAVVDKIVAAIEKIVEQKKNQITETIEIAPEKHRHLIGREGSIRKELEAKFKVTIDIPRQKPGETNTSPDIKITGIAEDVDKAKDHILEIVKEPEGETIEIPTRLYHAVADGGQFIRRLQRDFRVSVDHNGQQRPVKPTEQKPDLSGSLPLITDNEEDASQRFTWEVVESNNQGGEEGDFPWVIRGKPEQIAKAKTEIEKAVALAEQQSSIGYLMLPDSSKFRLIIGPGGSQVEQIRRDTGCRIIVPRNQDVGEPIVMHGSKEGIEKAKEIILGLVKNGDSNGRGRGRGNGDGGV
ncbi:hypothetical protein L873DRAFT_1693483 [Choiromyces venosus 120613-1]|uniref:K Homology domain-containing protein n=1 Tax=Choiromyces venosus 120613-1 TaxID=1336337 RepID=A0A3N4JF02_9PEZI|nr:hypothetical protein L873DRAFT_1693483 [Choiromyces venosus 120613-1]